MAKIIIDTANVHRAEVKLLKSYLEDNCWNWKEEKEIQPLKCEHRHTHVENITAGAICDDCGEEL